MNNMELLSKELSKRCLLIGIVNQGGHVVAVLEQSCEALIDDVLLVVCQVFQAESENLAT